MNGEQGGDFGPRPGPEPDLRAGASWQPKDSVQVLPGVGPARAEALARLGVCSLADLLLHLPRRYEEWSGLQDPAPPFVGRMVVVEGEVQEARLTRQGPRRSLVRVRFLAGVSGRPLEALFFNQPYLVPRFPPGARFRLQGKLEREGDLYRLRAPRNEKVEPGRVPRLQAAGAGIAPVYPEGEGLSSDFLSRLITLLLTAGLPERLGPECPEELAAGLELPVFAVALRRLHRPRPGEEREPGRRRLALEEAWRHLSQARRARTERAVRAAPRLEVGPGLEARILARFPFSFHPGQRSVWEEIRADLGRGRPMARLLQGDVGSGKTAVAAAAALAAVARGFQVALMAPTQVLAAQHRASFEGWLQGSQVRMGLLTGGTGEHRLREALATGGIDLVIGTHALIQDGVVFDRLGLVVIDEQQRFGVAQRARLSAGGKDPHLLVLSATPIPRTLALTLYGALDVSRLQGRPPGVRPVVTRVLEGAGWAEAVPVLRRHQEDGGLAYVVCPRIGPAADPGSVLGVRALLARAFPGLGVAVAHGEQGEAEREDAFGAFREGRAPILVATTVVEVGVDIPAATLMVVLEAHAFGLATLHQLRGRVGRGEKGGECLLCTGPDADRVRFLEAEADGFRVAEEDLRNRGPGEAAGLRQHGLGGFSALRPLQDLDLLERVRAAQAGPRGSFFQP